MIVNRTGQTVGITLHGKNGSIREIGTEAQLKGMLGGIGSNLGQIAKNSLLSLNARNFYLLLRIAVKKYVLNRTYEERHELMDSGFGIEYIEVEFEGKKLKLVEGGFLFLGLLDEIFVKNQYNAGRENIEGKVVVDAGANLGTFSLLCACLGAKKVYAFEPVGGTYGMLEKNIRANGLENIIVPVKKAVGEKDYEAEIKCDYAGDGGSSISMRNHERKNVQKIDVVALDGFFKGERVDFIKMDVEGFEEMALVGASSIIKKYKPVLSLSAYHKPTDAEVLPQTIRKIRDDYKITPLEYYEKDFYCE